MGFFDKLFASLNKREVKRIMPIVEKIEALEDEYRSLSDAELRAKTAEFKKRLTAGETEDDILPEAFATVREASVRVLEMRHFKVQLIGGIILHQGRIAEMKTGEGKTLVATLPAYLNALSGEGVHIVTVNDYLAKRDSEWMGKIFRFLGLKVGLIVHGLNHSEKQKAYAADITYGTNNEFGFDYLRDNMVTYKEQMVQRDHNFAIVDEVDSILIDEARTPLIISGEGSESTSLYEQADRIARRMSSTKIKEQDTKLPLENYDTDYIVDEKNKTVVLTPNGIKKAEQAFSVANLSDPDNSELYHHINQAIKAYGIMARDIDYVVKDGEVIIVDEFTGRLMYGRRYSQGLHQAIEAKEGVKVEKESKTLATITFQNYFRLYKKLSGMTGTAKTEESEFREIYKLDVVEIPTNRPMVRIDQPDSIYKTVNGKHSAIIEQIEECHKKGQPVLVGTISIERSELLASMLKKRGIKHSVLNAKYHEKEAEIIAQAGKKGAVTIATNMAGRGTDIVLGGNAEYMAKTEMRQMGLSEELINEATGHAETDDEAILNSRKIYGQLYKKYKELTSLEAQEVKKSGGLYILGTERHESRRIDNQLRGRAGRQGDPGESRFFLSLEDDLMRLFGGDRVMNIMNTLGLPEDQPIEHKILSNSIESAQHKVESINFERRKHVLQYDDVMNTQREVIYSQRRKVLDGEDLKAYISNMLSEVIDYYILKFTGENTVVDDWDLDGLRAQFKGIFLDKNDLIFSVNELNYLTKEKLKDIVLEKGTQFYNRKEEAIGADIMREIERVILLHNVDKKWMDHIDAMDDLKQGIGLRAYAQRDPVVAYRIEGYDMFEELIWSIKEDTVRMVFIANPVREDSLKRRQIAKPVTESLGETATKKREPVKKGKKIGRNEPCPCGSGKKFKKCCGMNED